MKIYIFVYLGTALSALVCTPVVILIARRLNIVDAPGVRKVHASCIPRIGGVAIVFAMLALTIPLLVFNGE
ncbi:unnamed protein product, partial [marine sediment metagenome]